MAGPRRSLFDRNSSVLPRWATSADFRDFERGSNGSVQPLSFETGGASEADRALTSQISDSGSAKAPTGIQQVQILRPIKGAIVGEAKSAGFTNEEAEYLYGQADKAAGKYVFRPKAWNPQVTAAEDQDYRREIEKAVPDPKLRERVLRYHEGQFASGRLRRVEKE